MSTVIKTGFISRVVLIALSVVSYMTSLSAAHGQPV